jgi:exopolysaccharide biosynthesis polyprenyl glycosylphosphotransferase
VTHVQRLAPGLTDASRGDGVRVEARRTHTATPAPATASWVQDYVRRLLVTDLVAVLVAVSTAQVVRFGVGTDPVLADTSLVSYTAVSVVLGCAWVLALAMWRAREPRVVGTGIEEYRRVAHASLGLFGTVAVVGFLLKLDLARGYLAVALPVGTVLLLLGRRSWRNWLLRQRAERRCYSSVLVVGSHRAAVAMAETFERDPAAGYRVVGVCEPGWGTTGRVLDIDGHRVPVLGDEHAVLDAIARSGADTVAVSNTEFLGADGMRALAWDLEATQTNLVVSSGVVDVAGPRLQISPVAGLPLLHVDKPQYKGASKFRKVAFDLVGATCALLVLSPLMLAIAVAVKLTSRGPVFYKAERIGLNGEPFAMMKFRSMVVHADYIRPDLLAQNEGAGPLFKLRDDPRVTPLGRWLRRYSLDELPQLFNVLTGRMSIVGPRPPLRSEVMTYSGEVHRRLLVKPGITGLWQVSGRSDLSWEESVRLDLYYVENWSFTQDLVISWRTLRAVVGSSGAY